MLINSTDVNPLTRTLGTLLDLLYRNISHVYMEIF